MFRDLWLRHILRPLGRLLHTNRWEPHAVAEISCLACGYECVLVIPLNCDHYDAESRIVSRYPCPECGESACTNL